MKRKILIGILIAIIIVCAARFGYSAYMEHLANETYKKAQEQAKVAETVPNDLQHKEVAPPEPIDINAQELATVDIVSLKEQNSQVIGWIEIPGIDISYPLVQGEDNSYYLKYSWDNQKNSAGSIYLDYRNNSNLEDFNSIIYGHNMSSGKMFSPILKYKDQSFYEASPSIYIVTEQKVLRYDIFSAYEADARGGHSYRLGLDTQEGKQAYINYCLQNSVINAKEKPSTQDSIITLSTCTQTTSYSYDTRWVVHAYLAYALEK